MPESVGTAYVRILADGTELDDSIRDELDGANPVIRASGRRGSAEYAEGWKQGLRKNGPSAKKINSALTSAILNGDLADEFFKSKKWAKFTADAEKRFGAMGRRAADALALEFGRRGSVAGIEKALEGFALRVQKEFEAAQKETKETADAMEEAAVEWRKALKKIDDDTARILGNVNVSMQRTDDQTVQTALTIRKTNLELDKMSKSVDKVTNSMKRHHSAQATFTRNWGRFADITGSITGRGSRNNFLNFMGSLTRNLTNLVGLLPKAVIGIGTFATDVAATFTKGGKGLAGFAAASGEVIAQLVALGAAGAVAAAALAAIGVIIIGPLISALVLLAGVITALAASLTFALIGGLAALAGLILPIAAAVGVLAAGIAGLDDAQKKLLKNSVKPLVAEFKTLGDIAAKGLFANAPKQIAGLVPVFQSLRPLVAGVADALSDVGDRIVKSLNTPEFKSWVTTMSIFLPNAVRKLGDIFVQSLGGVGGIFGAMAAPGGILERFLNWLDKITSEFNTWANSVKGQTELKTFFERAGDSASELGAAIEDITSLLSTLFDGTKEGGDSIITQLGDAAERFEKFLTSPEGQKAMEKWVEESEKFAESIGRIVVGIGVLIDILDNDFTRAVLGGTLRFMEFFNTMAAAGLEFIGDQFKSMGRALERIGEAAGTVTATVEAMLAVIGESIQPIIDWFEELVRTATDFSRIGDNIRANGFSLPGLSTVLTVMTSLHNRQINVRDLIDRIRNGGFSLPGLSGVRDVMASLGRLAGQVYDWIVKIGGTVFKVTGLDSIIIGMKSLSSAIDVVVGGLRRVAEAIRNMPSPRNLDLTPWDGLLPNFSARGRLVNGPMLSWIGEEGPEAVVPLNRPLSQVDPAVRELSAIAQGLSVPRMAAGGVVGGRSIDVGGMTVISPHADPRAVAAEVVNRLIASAY